MNIEDEKKTPVIESSEIIFSQQHHVTSKFSKDMAMESLSNSLGSAIFKHLIDPRDIEPSEAIIINFTIEAVQYEDK